jgi:hypothetical protein
MTNNNGSGSGYGNRDIAETAWGKFWATCIWIAAGVVSGWLLYGAYVAARVALEWAGVTW